MFTSTPLPNEEAAKMIADKPIFKKAAFNKLLPEVKARAFTLAGIEDADILQNVRGLLAEVPRGADWDKTKKGIAAELMKEWGEGLEGEALQKAMGKAMKRAEFNLRFHSFQAYQAGRWDTMQRQKDAFPYWQYVAFGDNRVRPTHEALNGLILPADDAFWQDHYPPWEWGCRCLVRALSDEDYLEELERDQKRAPDKKLILDDKLRKRMQDTGQLQRGTQTLDVRSPKAKLEAKGEDPSKAFGWNPADLRIPLDEIKGRYDKETWSTFEGWAGKERIEVGGERSGESISVLDWLRGSKKGKADRVPDSSLPFVEDVSRAEGRLKRVGVKEVSLRGLSTEMADTVADTLERENKLRPVPVSEVVTFLEESNQAMRVVNSRLEINLHTLDTVTLGKKISTLSLSKQFPGIPKVLPPAVANLAENYVEAFQMNLLHEVLHLRVNAGQLPLPSMDGANAVSYYSTMGNEELLAENYVLWRLGRKISPVIKQLLERL